MIPFLPPKTRFEIFFMTEAEESYPFLGKFKNILIGRAKPFKTNQYSINLTGRLFAWIGLGQTESPSSCLTGLKRLTVTCRDTRCWQFRGIGAMFLPYSIISSSYSQIIVFPAGRREDIWFEVNFFSPTVGMISPVGGPHH